jgi:MarR family transcriptional regulator for hemolysin
MDRCIAYLGLSYAMWMTLNMSANAKPVSQVKLADKLNVDSATVTAMLDRLVRRGMVQREPCSADRRVRHVALTALGKFAYEEGRRELASRRTQLSSGFRAIDLKSTTDLLDTIDLLCRTA